MTRAPELQRQANTFCNECSLTEAQEFIEALRAELQPQNPEKFAH